jgi:hypothetical protein
MCFALSIRMQHLIIHRQICQCCAHIVLPTPHKMLKKLVKLILENDLNDNNMIN